VARRQRLSEIQIAELFDPPAEQRELVRHYTLSEADLTAIARCRGDHNRLGLALMRCYLRYPGRTLRVGEPFLSRWKSILASSSRADGNYSING
jgi:TnpA family transposase